MVETGGLENRCTGNRTGGSNPSPSATDLGCRDLFHSFENRRILPHKSKTPPANRTGKSVLELPSAVFPLEGAYAVEFLTFSALDTSLRK